MKRSSAYYLFFTAITIAVGISTRLYSCDLPVWIHLYLGDVLWALMVYWIFGFLFSRKSSRWIAAAALLFSFGIELSQLLHASWIDAIRHTHLGGLILGYGFLWSDLACYTIGIGAGYISEILFIKESKA